MAEGHRPLISRLGESQVAAWVALGLATLASCPWGLSGGRVFVQRDTAFTLVAMRHLQDALLGLSPWTRGPLGWPLEGSVTQSDWVLLQALAALPLRGGDPLLAHGILVLAGLFLTAVACHQVARALTGPGPHTWVAGVAGGLGPLHLAHGAHVNLVHHEVAVLGALALGVGLARRRPALAAVGAAAAGLGFHLGVYLGLHGVLALGAVAVVAAVARAGDRPTWLAAAGGLALAALVALPVALVYHRFEVAHGVALDSGALRLGSWILGDALLPTPGAPLHEVLSRVLPQGPPSPNPPNPGYALVALGLAGVAAAWRSERRWPWVAVGVAGGAAALLALGPDIRWTHAGASVPGPHRLVELLPGVAGLRSPARWLWVLGAALGLLASGALARWLPRRPVARVGASVGVCALLLVETPPTITAPRAAYAAPAVYLLLSQGEGPVFDTALVREERCRCRVEPLWAAWYHGRPLVGGSYARHVDALAERDAILRTWPSAEARALLDEIGVLTVVEHPPLEAQVPGAVCTGHGAHRLCELPGVPPGAVP